MLQRKGAYAPPPGASDLPGLEIAGSIIGGDAAELAAAGFKLGDRVCALVAGGGYAELCPAPIAQCLPVPAGLSDIEAASLPETFFTVWSNVFDRGRLQAGETLLVQGGSSGIGVTVIQLAKAVFGKDGARVIVTAGSDEKVAACVALGADVGINYKTQDFVAEVKAATGGKGADVVLDMVAGDYVAREVQCLADDGRIVIIAVQGGLNSGFNAGELLRRRDFATPAVGLQGGHCGQAEDDRLAVDRSRSDQAGDPPCVPGGAGSPGARPDGIERACRQDRARLDRGLKHHATQTRGRQLEDARQPQRQCRVAGRYQRRPAVRL